MSELSAVKKKLAGALSETGSYLSLLAEEAGLDFDSQGSMIVLAMNELIREGKAALDLRKGEFVVFRSCAASPRKT